MRILFTLCGRAGSKGIKNKNIKDFVGCPLPYYSVAVMEMYIRTHPEHDIDVALNTDSTELIDLIDNYTGLKIQIVERCEELAGDTVGKIEVIRDTFFNMSQRNNVEYDWVVDLDITSPLRTLKDLENLISKSEETKCDICYSVVPSRRNPYFNMVTKKDRGYGIVFQSGFTARQQAPEIFDMNASLYAYSNRCMKEKIGFADGYCEIISMMDTGVLDLDHEHDLEIMEIIAGWLFENNVEFKQVRETALAGK